MRVQTDFVRLQALDELDVEVLALGIAEDEHILQGTAGFCDWRLNGRLSSMLMSGSFAGHRDEILLTDTGSRIGTQRVLLVGLGKREGLDITVLSQVFHRLFEVVSKARFGSLAFEPPNIFFGLREHTYMIDALFKAALSVYPEVELTVLCVQKVFAEQLAKQAKQYEHIRFVDKNQ